MGKEQLGKTQEQEGIQNELQSEETRQQQKRTGQQGGGPPRGAREMSKECRLSMGVLSGPYCLVAAAHNLTPLFLRASGGRYLHL